MAQTLSEPPTTLTEVARQFKTTKQTVDNWKRKTRHHEACPHLQKPPYDIAKIREWREENIGPRTNERNEATLSLTDEGKSITNRLKLAQAIAQEYENAIDAKELVNPADTQASLERQALAFRKEIIGLTNNAVEIVGLKDADQAREKLREIGNKILERLWKGER